jgi:hypothetical protein
MRRIAFHLLGYNSISLLEFYGLNIEADCGGALPRHPAACLLHELDLTVRIKQTVAPVKYDNVCDAVSTQPNTESVVELAFDRQAFYDVRVLQRTFASDGLSAMVPLTIFQQCKLSKDPATTDNEVRAWIGMSSLLIHISCDIYYLKLFVRVLCSLQQKRLRCPTLLVSMLLLGAFRRFKIRMQSI